MLALDGNTASIVVAIIAGLFGIVGVVVGNRRSLAAKNAALAAREANLMAQEAVIASTKATEELHAEVKTNHGKRAGEYLENISHTVDLLAKAVVEIKEDRLVEVAARRATDEIIRTHTEQDGINFKRQDERFDDVMRELARTKATQRRATS